MPRTRNESLAQQRREDVLAAAAGVFRRKGFHAARTEEICSAARISPGTLFRHFRDKDEIIAAVVETQTAVYVRLVEDAFSAQGMQAMLALDVETLARYLAPEAGGLSSESWLELARNPALHPLAREADQRIRKAIAAGVRAAQAAGLVRPTLDAEEAAEMLNALFSGLMFDQELSPERDLKPVARALAGLLRRYLLDQPPTTRRRR
jgi:AcrR family transcriptional regulator